MIVRGVKRIEHQASIDVKDLEASILEQFVEDYHNFSSGVVSYAGSSETSICLIE